MKKRIAVLVSGGGTNLQALLEAEEAGKIPHGEIAMVISNTLITNALVLSAVTLIILYRTKDTLAEQTVTLRLVGTIVDSLWLEHLAA